jgi:HlyD family secretion protein
MDPYTWLGSTAVQYKRFIPVDIQRPDLKRKQRKRSAAVAAVLIVLSGAGVYGVSHLKPALPSVDRSAIWTDTVKRGPMVRQVRGIGTLVPREDRLRLIPAETDGTVVRIDILPGAKVNPDSVLMELSDPQVQQELVDAQLQFRAATVEYKNLQPVRSPLRLLAPRRRRTIRRLD